jgi:HEAT repeat protein
MAHQESISIRGAQRRTSIRTMFGLALGLAVSLLLPIAGRTAYGLTQEATSGGGGARNHVQASGGTQLFSEARTLFEDENWVGAAEKFRAFISGQPQDKNVEAALYWLSIALKKQEKYQEAEQALDRLMKDFPQSSWAGNARMMRVELAAKTGNRRAVEDALTDNDEDVRLVALQNLVHTEPARAVAFIAQMLKPDANASSQMKLAGVKLLGDTGSPQATPLLIEIARQQTDQKLRKAALYSLGHANDESALDFLKELASQPADAETAKAAAFAIAHLPGERAGVALAALARTSPSREIQHNAVMWLAQKETDFAINELADILDMTQDAELRSMCLLSLGQSSSPRARAKLLDIARRGSTHETRMYAILGLGQRGDERSLDALITLYGEEKEEAIKEWVLMALGQAGQKRGLRKLMEIARTEASPRMRQAALHSLERHNNNDPEVEKFLRDFNRQE